MSPTNEQKDIVRDDRDRENRLHRFRRTVKVYGWRPHAFAVMRYSLITIGLLALLPNARISSASLGAETGAKSDLGGSSCETILREVRAGRLSKEESKSALPVLLKAYLQRRDNQFLSAIRTIHLKDPDALDSLSLELAALIGDSQDQKVLAELYEMLTGIDGIPEAVFTAVTQRHARRDEEKITLGDISAVAIILRADPAASEDRQWLEKLLAHKNATIRMTAANALGGAGEGARKSVPRLRELTLQDASNAVRVVAAHALWRIDHDPKPVVPVLVEAIRKEGEGVVLKPLAMSEWVPDHRLVAAHLLGEIGLCDQGVTGALLSVLGEKDDVLLRIAAIESLGRLNAHNDEVIRELKALRADPNEGVRNAAREAVDCLGPTTLDVRPAKARTSLKSDWRRNSGKSRVGTNWAKGDKAIIKRCCPGITRRS